MQKFLKNLRFSIAPTGVSALMIGLLAACSTDSATLDRQIAASLERNPNLVFQAIEKNPEKFFEVVNRAALDLKRTQSEQAKQARELEFRRDLEKPKRPVLSPQRLLDGKSDAKIQLVEYADFQCPACGLAFQGLEEFKAKHKGEFLFVFKHMPLSFHKMAYPAALYFEAIRKMDKDLALKFYRLIYEHQERLTSESELLKMAQEVGVEPKKLKASLREPALRALIEADMKEFEGFGFSGTPVVIMNGVALSGAQSAEDLELAYKKIGSGL